MNSKSLAGILVTIGVLIGLGAVSCSVGVFDGWMGTQQRPQASAPQSTPMPSQQSGSTTNAATGGEGTTGTVAAPQTSADGSAQQAGQGPTQQGTDTSSGTTPQAGTVASTHPSFDIVRIEPDGSVVIAGIAAPNATVSLLHGSRQLAQATADGSGSFAVVLDDPLKPGDYQLVLRATDENGTVMMSGQTAVVAVPENPNGEVLALVEEPGAPSRLITVPTGPEIAPVDQPAQQAGAPSAQPQQPQSQQAQQSQTPSPITVQAIEIEGDRIFIAGQGIPGKRVRVHANDSLLGQSDVAADGRYLVEARRNLPVGDYLVRAELLERNGRDVIARVTVPFRRVAGENLSAAAPVETQAQTAAAHEETSPLQQVDGSVIIRRGDTLWQISRRVYGYGTRYTTIYLANQDAIRNPDLIRPGQVFSVPERSQQGESANIDVLRERAQTR